MLSTPIFKRDSIGRLRTWSYEVDGARYRTTSGLVDGEQVTSGWTTCEPKSQPTAEAQAIFEANSDEKKKLERVYRRTVAELEGPMMFEPMLAKPFEKFTGRCYSQPKLDGIRCVATAEGLFSRQGKPITGLPHIEASLKPLFDQFPDVVIDGELYNHDMRDQFEKIVSAVRKKSGHPDAGKIQYHVYDCFLGGEEIFSERLQFVYYHLAGRGPAISVVPTAHIGTSYLLDEMYADYMEQGFEGQMVRLDKPYENKRSRSLLKRKEFDDGEFTISSILEGNGNWHGYAKRIEFFLPDGRICGGGIKGDQPRGAELLRDADLYRGGQVTIRHFGFTNDGMPRFPVAVAIHKEKRDY
jgi:DNA ligase-1